MELYEEDRGLVPKRPAVWRGYALSSWPRRVVAALLDTLLISLGWMLIGLAFGLSLDELHEDAPGFLPSHDELLGLAAAALSSLLYYPLIMRATDGATIGKRLARIRVVRTDGKPMTLTRAAWREAGVKTVALGAIPLPLTIPACLLNYLWPLWDPENRAVHDMIAGTRVVRAE
jgi:uncharacterized RDD family membrane protein YckC